MRQYFVPALALTLSACGGSTDDSGTDAVADDGQEVASEDAVQGTGTAAIEKLNCNAVKARKAQGPDILGISIGTTDRHAFEALACAMPNAFVESRKFDDGTANHSIKDETGNLLVNIDGPLNDQRVVQVVRNITFNDENAPLRENFRKQMEQKFGQFTQTEADKPYDAWKLIKTADGAVLKATDALYAKCQNQSGDANCGMFVKFQTQGVPADSPIAKYVAMEVTDLNYAAKQKQARTASVQNENAQRLQQDVNNAAGNRPEL